MSHNVPARHHLDRRVDTILRRFSKESDALLTTREVADWLGVSPIWVEIGRSKGYGPPFIKIGPRYIRYRPDDVVEWMKSRSRRITSEYTALSSESSEASAR